MAYRIEEVGPGRLLVRADGLNAPRKVIGEEFDTIEMQYNDSTRFWKGRGIASSFGQRQRRRFKNYSVDR